MANRKKDNKGSKRHKKALPGNWSVYQRAGDGRWVAKFKAEETGRYKELYAQSEDEANEKLQQALFEQKQGVLATGPKQTVAKYLTQWTDDTLCLICLCTPLSVALQYTRIASTDIN